ncbi:universal stress protein [Natronomonas sp. LN261]|jgi:nucleotide-binding universal stress UspA family protein|uniref:universal stress protein n=1 Tax=Natronomonas sp. LN261 TaxID=2750669 RepID=UPI0015EE72D0|nr:universal stress protein [Natronomonas sp. LN261]
MYDRILLPTDGSRGNSRAVDQAIGLAGETDAVLHALFVVEDIPSAPEMSDGQFQARLEQIGEEAIEDIRARADDAGVEIETAIENGDPHRAILEYADEEAMDLVVMGTHGRSGLDRYLLGSVTERVVRASDVPVLTVRVEDDQA